MIQMLLMVKQLLVTNKVEISPDIIIVPCGGGGLISGISQYIKQIMPSTIIVGVEPSNANSLQLSNTTPKTDCC